MSKLRRGDCAGHRLGPGGAEGGLGLGRADRAGVAQNAIAPVFETIASAMRSDMTPRDAGQEFSRYVEDIPATLAATGWLALIGGGLASVRDIKNPQADVDVALRHWGFSAEQSRRIKAAATPEAFDEAVHEEMPRRTPENIAAGRRRPRPHGSKPSNSKPTPPSRVWKPSIAESAAPSGSCATARAAKPCAPPTAKPPSSPSPNSSKAPPGRDRRACCALANQAIRRRMSGGCG